MKKFFKYLFFLPLILSYNLDACKFVIKNIADQLIQIIDDQNVKTEIAPNAYPNIGHEGTGSFDIFIKQNGEYQHVFHVQENWCSKTNNNFYFSNSDESNGTDISDLNLNIIGDAETKQLQFSAEQGYRLVITRIKE